MEPYIEVDPVYSHVIFLLIQIDIRFIGNINVGLGE